jgi:hypothetical protein
MVSTGKVGPQAGSVGAEVPQAMTQMGAAHSADASARYYEPTRAGRVFRGGNQSAVALTAGLATTYTGLCLINPAGSGKNLSLLSFGISTSAAHSALSNYGLLGGYAAGGITAFTAIATTLWGPNLIGTNANNSVASLAAAGVTLVGTPRFLMHCGSAFTTQSLNSTGLFDVAGQIVVQPGGYVAISAIAAYTAAGLFSFTWEEVPIAA